MGTDELKIPVTVPGADDAKRKLHGVAAAQKKVGDAGQAAGKKLADGYDRAQKRLKLLEAKINNLRYAMNASGRATADQTRRMQQLTRAAGGYRSRLQEVDSATSKVTGATNALTGGVGSLIQGYLGLRGIMWILGKLQQETEKVDETTRKLAESLRAVLALSALKGERQETQDAIQKMAVDAGRKVEEVAPAYYTLLGGTAGMAPERQQGLMRQALLMAKTDPTAGIDPIVNLLTTIASQNPDMSPRQIGNLVSKTIEQAKSTPEEMAQYLPDVLSAAKAGKAPIGLATAMFSFSTRKGGGVAKSGQAVKSAMLGLLAPSPDVAKELAKYGYQSGASLEEKINWMASAGGQLPPELQTALGGRRGIQAVTAIADAPGEFAAERRLMTGALNAEGSLLKDRLTEMYGESPAQRYLDQLNQLDVMLESEYVDPDAMPDQVMVKLNELIETRTFGTTLWKYPGQSLRWLHRNITGEPMMYVEGTPNRALQNLVLEGYSPQDVMGVLGSVADESTTYRKGGYTEDFRQQLQDAGAQPMQGDTYNYYGSVQNGGTKYEMTGKQDPAGQPRTPAGAGM